MDFNVLNYGAVGDGSTNDVKAIQTAIDECSKQGGRVVIPSGYTFYTSSIEIKKDVELHLEKDAVLKATGDINEYIRPCNMINDPETALVGNPVTEKPSFVFVYGKNADNCSITGEGTIDGNCYAFVERQNEYYVTGNFYPRPTMIYIEDSDNLLFKDITLTNAPFWTLHPAACENVLIDSIKILNPLDVANSDGIDPDHSHNVEIKNCTVICADDCICLKNTNGNREYGECTDIYVHDCELTSTSAAIKIGTEGINNFKNVLFERCNITKSNRGISIQIRDCGNVENVTFKDISIQTRRFHSSWWGTAEPIIITSFRRDENTTSGRIKGITFKNIRCESENGVLIYCDNGEIEDITFDNVKVEVGKKSKWDCGLYDLRPCIDHGIEEHKNCALRIKNANYITLLNSEFGFTADKHKDYSYDLLIENVNNMEIANTKFDTFSLLRHQKDT